MTDSAGRPISRVQITISPSDRYGILARTSTDKQGHFQTTDLPPGHYIVSAHKGGWRPTQQVSDLTGQTDAEPKSVSIVMQLTTFYLIAQKIRSGMLAYVLIFGLLLLAANYWIAPQPSREANIAGWAFMVVAVGIACVKLEWLQAAVLLVLGSVASLLIHKYGRQSAAKRLEENKQRRLEEESLRNQERERLESFIGKQAVTLTPLSPYGNATMDDQVVEVKASSGFIPADTRVIVRAMDGKTPVVDPQI